MPEPGRSGHFDVIIAGGGLVGGSLALALASDRLRVALIEAVPPSDPAQPSFDDRSIALSHGSCRLLQAIGVWPSLAADAWPVHRIHVSEQGSFGTAMIAARQQGISELGFVISGRALGQALWQALPMSKRLTTVVPAQVTATGLLPDGLTREVTVTEANGQTRTLQTRLLVVADGARSTLRAQLGIRARERDYGQVATVARVQVGDPKAGTTAYERFTADGPLALLPGANGRYTLVYAQPVEQAGRLQQLTDDAFIDVVQRAIGYRLGRLSRPGKRHSYPLTLLQADQLTAPRAVLIGNAAHALHPVAGQGFNLGLRDVACLAELLLQTSSVDPADVIDEYAAWRASDQRRLVGFTDGLIRLFAAESPLPGALRGLGLSLFDVIPGAGRELARQTMGYTGRVPRLLRGLAL